MHFDFVFDITDCLLKWIFKIMLLVAPFLIYKYPKIKIYLLANFLKFRRSRYLLIH
jgi:hypothetical protein